LRNSWPDTDSPISGGQATCEAGPVYHENGRASGLFFGPPLIPITGNVADATTKARDGCEVRDVS
jgi:hypothetical protein